MEIPSIFYGTKKNVKSRLITLLKNCNKGYKLDDAFKKYDLLESFDTPQSYIWLDDSFSYKKSETHFHLYLLGELIHETQKEKEIEFRNNAIEYFSGLTWGCALLNSTQGYSWCACNKPDNEGYVDFSFAAKKILESSSLFWEKFSEMGKVFYAGGLEPCTFIECTPLSYFILRQMRVNTSEFPQYELKANPPLPAYGNIKKICDKYKIVEGLINKESYWLERARYKIK